MKSAPQSIADWDLFRAFFAFVTTKSTNGAAQQLGTYTATLKRRMARLEDIMRCQLYDGYGDRLKVTEEGEQLMELLWKVDEKLALVSASKPRETYKAKPKPKVRIHAYDLLGELLLMPFLDANRELLDDFEIELLSGPMPETRQAFPVDIVLSPSPIQTDQVTSIPLGNYQVGFCCSKDYAATYGMPDVSNLGSHSLIRLANLMSYHDLWATQSVIASQCKSQIKTDSLSMSRDMISRSLGLGLTVPWGLGEEIVVCPSLPILEWSAFVAVRKTIHQDPGFCALMTPLVAAMTDFFGDKTRLFKPEPRPEQVRLASEVSHATVA